MTIRTAVPGQSETAGGLGGGDGDGECNAESLPSRGSGQAGCGRGVLEVVVEFRLRVFVTPAEVGTEVEAELGRGSPGKYGAGTGPGLHLPTTYLKGEALGQRVLVDVGRQDSEAEPKLGAKGFVITDEVLRRFYGYNRRRS